jgi:hypothetical protein
MKDNEIALQSQQLSEQTGNRQARALEQQGQAWSHLPDMVTGFQQAYARSQQIDQAAQAHQMDMAKGASSLALDELRRKQAMEELQWAGQLHGADMMEMDKRQKAAQTALVEAQTQKAITDLNVDPNAGLIMKMSEEEKDSLIEDQGITLDFSGGKVKAVPATPEQRSQAGARRAKNKADALAQAEALRRISSQSVVDAARIRGEASVKAAEQKALHPVPTGSSAARQQAEDTRMLESAYQAATNASNSRDPEVAKKGREDQEKIRQMIQSRVTAKFTQAAPAAAPAAEPTGDDLLRKGIGRMTDLLMKTQGQDKK